MRFRVLQSLMIVSCAALLLGGCEFQRASDAAEAKQRMIGWPKEDVLACMGPPKRKATVGETEVWQYHSTNDYKTSHGLSHRQAPNTFSFSESSKYYCDVNVVMKGGTVAALHYNGPRGGLLTSDEQCGYAVEHCVGD